MAGLSRRELALLGPSEIAKELMGEPICTSDEVTRLVDYLGAALDRLAIAERDLAATRKELPDFRATTDERFSYRRRGGTPTVVDFAMFFGTLVARGFGNKSLAVLMPEDAQPGEALALDLAFAERDNSGTIAILALPRRVDLGPSPPVDPAMLESRARVDQIRAEYERSTKPGPGRDA